MGFPEDVCAEALERYDGDENLALNYLLGGWNLKGINANNMIIISPLNHKYSYI